MKNLWNLIGKKPLGQAPAAQTPADPKNVVPSALSTSDNKLDATVATSTPSQRRVERIQKMIEGDHAANQERHRALLEALNQPEPSPDDPGRQRIITLGLER